MKQRYERIYVKVDTIFDLTGYMHPKRIIWSDGRSFDIEACRPCSVTLDGESYLKQPGAAVKLEYICIPVADIGRDIDNRVVTRGAVSDNTDIGDFARSYRSI